MYTYGILINVYTYLAGGWKKEGRLFSVVAGGRTRSTSLPGMSQFPHLLDHSQIPFFLLPLVNTDSFVTGREKMKGKQQASTEIRRSTLTMFDFREQETRSKAFKSSTEFPQLFLKGFL